MALVVLLRGVNIGGYRHLYSTALANDGKHPRKQPLTTPGLTGSVWREGGVRGLPSA